jgi:hypothetical protein
MSAILTTRRRTTTPMKPAGPVEETDKERSRYLPEVQHLAPEVEAPEEATREEEAPESWEEWKTEAPDGGRGECLDREFTHGRSRS